jgi:hypothetical protein
VPLSSWLSQFGEARCDFLCSFIAEITPKADRTLPRAGGFFTPVETGQRISERFLDDSIGLGITDPLQLGDHGAEFWLRLATPRQQSRSRGPRTAHPDREILVGRTRSRLGCDRSVSEV